MTKQETLKILAILKTMYPEQFKNVDGKLLADIWQEQLSDCSYQDIDKAVRAYIATNETNFAPSIGKLRSMVVKLNQPEAAYMTAQEAANLVQRAVANSGHHAQEEFAQLPPVIQRIVRTPQTLFEWSQMDVEAFQSVILSNFQRSYQTAVKQEMENEQLPEGLKILPEKTAVEVLLEGLFSEHKQIEG